MSSAILLGDGTFISRALTSRGRRFSRAIINLINDPLCGARAPPACPAHYIAPFFLAASYGRSESPPTFSRARVSSGARRRRVTTEADGLSSGLRRFLHRHRRAGTSRTPRRGLTTLLLAPFVPANKHRSAYAATRRKPAGSADAEPIPRYRVAFRAPIARAPILCHALVIAD